MALKLLQILFDVNVLLDYLLKRQPYYADAAYLWRAVASARIEGYIAATSLPTLWYLSQQERRRVGGISQAQALVLARQDVRICLDHLRVGTVNYKILDYAEKLPFDDFEDSALLGCVRFQGYSYIATRDADLQKFSQLALPPATIRQRI